MSWCGFWYSMNSYKKKYYQISHQTDQVVCCATGCPLKRAGIGIFSTRPLYERYRKVHACSIPAFLAWIARSGVSIIHVPSLCALTKLSICACVSSGCCLIYKYGYQICFICSLISLFRSGSHLFVVLSIISS